MTKITTAFKATNTVKHTQHKQTVVYVKCPDCKHGQNYLHPRSMTRHRKIFHPQLKDEPNVKRVCIDSAELDNNGHENDDYNMDEFHYNKNENFYLDVFRFQQCYLELLSTETANYLKQRNTVVAEEISKQFVQTVHCSNCDHEYHYSNIFKSTSRDYDDIFSFVTENNLSEATGDSLLAFLTQLLGRHKIIITFPKAYRSIKKLCQRKTDIFTTLKDNIHLDPIYFGIKDVKGKNLRKTEVSYLDIQEQLATSMLQMDPENFITNKFVDNNTFQGIETGEIYKNIYHAVQYRFHGNDEYFSLMLGFTLDDTTLNSGRSKTVCPLLFYVMNKPTDDFKMTLLGYCPTKLPYSDTHLNIF
jgi:ribosomal protein S27E